MSAPKEIFLELIKPDGQPERQLRQYEALHMCLDDPINTYLRGNRKRGTVSVDRVGDDHQLPAGRARPHARARRGRDSLPGYHALERDCPCT